MCTQSYIPEGEKRSVSCICRKCEYESVGGIGYMTSKMCRSCFEKEITTRKFGVVRANKHLDDQSPML